MEKKAKEDLSHSIEKYRKTFEWVERKMGPQAAQNGKEANKMVRLIGAASLSFSNRRCPTWARRIHSPPNPYFSTNPQSVSYTWMSTNTTIAIPTLHRERNSTFILKTKTFAIPIHHPTGIYSEKNSTFIKKFGSLMRKLTNTTIANLTLSLEMVMVMKTLTSFSRGI